ncbi:MAG: Rrf2 family transcriptional regulator [Elusimicrobia bacterium]|nr:Rrf2 family transcriptional regulator [Elusimicrobiota bacterium]
MARCLNLTRTGEYAIAALARLALSLNASDSAPTSVRTLAQEQEIPKSFLSKILAQCVKAGIARSKKGPDGGVVLARPPEEISLLAIIEACEGSYWRELCVFYPARRCDGPRCEVYCPLREKEERVRNELGQTTLADMAKALQKHPYPNMEHI